MFLFVFVLLNLSGHINDRKQSTTHIEASSFDGGRAILPASIFV
jgi:hypothetical protein